MKDIIKDRKRFLNELFDSTLTVITFIAMFAFAFGAGAYVSLVYFIVNNEYFIEKLVEIAKHV